MEALFSMAPEAGIPTTARERTRTGCGKG
uniref:Uncharacterized protein n=1 Tax=Anguilla anguilla TaxID=7936 RepID=A0A0E9XQG6_ANGAN